MGVSFSRLGLLLAAAATQPNLHQDTNYDFWVSPSPGHYKNDNPRVGKLPSITLDILYDEASRHQRFEVGLGTYSERGDLSPIGEKQLVVLQKADGTEEVRYPLERCATLMAPNYMTLAAYVHYDVPGWQDFTSTSSLYLCLVSKQGWTIYFGAETADDHLTRLYMPVVLDSPPSVLGSTGDKTNTVEALKEKTPAESTQETASESAMNLRNLDLPGEGYYVGAFEMKEHGKKGRVGVSVRVAGSDAQLILRADLRRDEVKLDPAPLEQASDDCWRLAVKSLDENMGHVEGAVNAIKDLAGIDSLSMEDILLCFVDGKWKLLLGSKSLRVVSLDKWNPKRPASRKRTSGSNKKRRKPRS